MFFIAQLEADRLAGIIPGPSENEPQTEPQTEPQAEPQLATAGIAR